MKSELSDDPFHAGKLQKYFIQMRVKTKTVCSDIYSTVYVFWMIWVLRTSLHLTFARKKFVYLMF